MLLLNLHVHQATTVCITTGKQVQMQMQREYVKDTHANKSKLVGKVVIQKQDSSCNVQTKQSGQNQNQNHGVSKDHKKNSNKQSTAW